MHQYPRRLSSVVQQDQWSNRITMHKTSITVIATMLYLFHYFV